jgi:hypothetical protein
MRTQLRLAALLGVLLLLTAPACGQNSGKQADRPCGAAKVNLANPEYLTTPQGIIVAEAPPGWALNKRRSGAFFFTKVGSGKSDSSVLMYIAAEPLETTFENAIQADIQQFREKCERLDVKDAGPAGILEMGCAHKTQVFSCRREQNPYTELVTKIGFNGTLLNVVLSADDADGLAQNRSAYDYLLKHLTMVK